MARRRRHRRSPVRVAILGLVAVLVLGGVVAVILSLGPGGGGLHPIRSGTPVAALFFTCGLEGKLAPCTCEEGELGGVARLGGLFEQWRAERADAILVDVGNAAAVKHKQAREINSFTYEAFDAIGYSVANIGESEVALTRDQLVALGGATRTRIISASVTDAGSGQHLFPLYHVEVRGGIPVGFIGLVDDKVDTVGSGLRILAPEDALRDALGNLGDKAGVIVVLAYLPPDRIYELARKYPKVNVFLGGKAGASSAPYEMVRRVVIKKTGAPGQEKTERSITYSVIAYLGDQGFSAGRLHAAFPKDGIPVVDGTIRLVDKTVAPSGSLKDLAARFDKAVPPGQAPGATLDPKMPGTSSFIGSDVCRLCHTPEFYNWQKTAHGGAYVTLLQKGKQNDERCLACHTTGWGMPAGFIDKRVAAAQAKAAEDIRKLKAQLARLAADAPERAERQKQLDELKEVDLGDYATLIDADDNVFGKQMQSTKNALEALKGMGCENCHGGARRHAIVAGKDRSAVAKTPYQRADSSARACARCHNGGRPCLADGMADPFETEAYMDKIKHWP